MPRRYRAVDMKSYVLALLPLCFLILQGRLVCHGFNAHLTRPWQFKRGFLRIRARKRRMTHAAAPNTDKAQPTRTILSVAPPDSSSSLSSSSIGSSNNPDPANNQQANVSVPESLREITRMTPPLLETNSSLSDDPVTSSPDEIPSIQIIAKPPPPTVMNQLGPLTRMTRPQNFPGIFVFHVVGVYSALKSVNRMDVLPKMLLASPSMWLVFSCIILVSCTSMIVNDYYDAKLGRDRNTDRPLVTGDLSFRIVRRYLSYLYGVALLCGALLPGTLARLSVVFALMLTYWYTNHLKPLTWVKNAVCAFLIAFAPLTSGSAALHLVSQSTDFFDGMNILRMGPIWRVVGMLLFGIFGREMTMDCNDVENDRAVGVKTIPVVHGPVFASRVALACAVVSNVFALVGPIGEIGRAPVAGWARCLAFASAASLIQFVGAWRVWRTEGRNSTIVSSTVDAAAISTLFFLASYL